MKWSNIPQFTRRANYRVDQPLDYIEGWLNRYIGHGLILEPDFQRAHVWTPEQQTAYVEYFLRGGLSGRDFYFNQYGFSSGASGSEQYPFVLVDGLQRLTALRKFMANDLPVFDGSKRLDIEGKFPILDYSLSVHINNLKTRAEVLTWYYEMNSGSTPHTKEELDKVKKLLEEEKVNAERSV